MSNTRRRSLVDLSGQFSPKEKVPARLSDPAEFTAKTDQQKPLQKETNERLLRRATMIPSATEGNAELSPVRFKLEKRKSLILEHNSFPDMPKPMLPDLFGHRKPLGQLMEEVSALKSMGVSTGEAVPSELNIFREREGTKLIMSSFDLWGPQHAKQAMKKLGYYEAFKTLEGRDRRMSLKMESTQAEKFNPRMADDVSLMKALNKQKMASSQSATDVHGRHSLDPLQPATSKAKALFSIIDSCDQLCEENRVYRKKLAPLPKVALTEKTKR